MTFLLPAVTMLAPRSVRTWFFERIWAPPNGLHFAGTKPAPHKAGTGVQATCGGDPSAYLKSKEAVPVGFGTLMQAFDNDKYGGARVRFCAFAKSEAVEGWAGLWMRAERGTQMLALDHMQDRAIKETAGWKSREIVLEVPQDATAISLRVLLSKTGTVWLDNVNFEVVGSDPPTAGRKDQTKVNFEKE